MGSISPYGKPRCLGQLNHWRETLIALQSDSKRLEPFTGAALEALQAQICYPKGCAHMVEAQRRSSCGVRRPFCGIRNKRSTENSLLARIRRR